jgi:hypothetical protein
MDTDNHFTIQKPLNQFLSTLVDHYFHIDIPVSQLSINEEFILPFPRITFGYFFNHPFTALISKRKRMKFVFVNGMGLITLACFLYYRSHYQTIDSTFLVAQVAEFVLGLINLALIGLNIKSGFQLSGRIKKQKPVKTAITN